MLRFLAAAVLALAAPLAGAAGPIEAQSVTGEVMANGAPVYQGQPLVAYADIVTGSSGEIVLHFSDGMELAVQPNSRLRIVDYRYHKGRHDRAVFELLRGAARVSTGEVVRANPKQFFFRTPQAEFGVQGPADFAVALVNPAYLAVNVGTVTATNGAGTVAFAAGSTATVASSSALATPIAASALPPQAASALGQLQATALSTPGGAAAGAAGTAAGGVGLGTGALVGVGIAGAAAALGGDGDGGTTTTHHH